jgi:serine/threonine protein kinase
LYNEITIMRTLSHPNIVELLEVYENEKYLYLVLELLSGGELFEKIASKNTFTLRQTQEVMKCLLLALDYLHANKIMHRDLKPENLLLIDDADEMKIKVADFGLCTYVSPDFNYEFKRCGTPGFVAPEVLLDQKYTEKVDIFSAGVIFYMLLTGKSPFDDKHYKAVLKKNKDCNINFNFEAMGIKLPAESRKIFIFKI